MESTLQPGHDNPDRPFPIVAIGASAGGLDSLVRFLSVLPDEFGFALVFMQHLSPAHKSLLPELLSARKPALIIEEVSDGIEILPGKLYLCPPAQEVGIEKGTFRVASHSREHKHLPIDEFFISLAKNVAERAIAVILSGAGTDGARGVHAVRTAGGTVFVQDPQTAEFSAMPLAALGTGQVDGVLSPEDIAREILKFHTSDMVGPSPDSLAIEPFFPLIYEKTGYRFNHHKKSVVSRRIKRRMYLQGLSSVSAYLEKIATDDGEARLLASDLMIGVTSFFRDLLAWEALHLEVTRKLVAEDETSPIRVWAPACATGEEAYSITMLLQHELDSASKTREIQVFATDVNDQALEKAREGTYPATIAADVQAEYLSKFFTSSEDSLSLTINKEIRQLVVFAKQDILTDPPFSRLDLVICRNLLIYLEPDAQEKCIALFHYALKEGGYLFLGGAESPGRNKGLFASLAHKKCRIYRKIETKASTRTPLAVPFASEHPPLPAKRSSSPSISPSVVELSQEVLLDEFAPAAVTINQNYDVLYNNGPTSKYLRQPRGPITSSLLDLLPESARNRIRGAIYRAGQDGKAVIVRVDIPEDSGRIRQVTIRISNLREGLYLVIFREKGSPSSAPEEISPDVVDMEEAAVRQLEQELSTTRDDLQSHIEQLKSLNEELHSSNEELQAANEELETSREELQSLNEELTTVNAQLQTKIEDEEETNNDLANFLASTNIPTIFLDHQLRVKRYTPAMSRLIKLLSGDVGRPIIDMSQAHLGPDLVADAQSVLDNLTPATREFGINGAWYVRNILPYRTSDNRIEGVVITYTDISDRKGQEEETRGLLTAVQEEKDRLSALIASIQDEVWFADTDKRFTLANPSALREFGLGTAHAIDVEKMAASLDVYRPDGTPRPVDEAPPLRALTGEIVKNQEEIIRTPASDELRYRQVSAGPVRDADGNIIGSVSVVRDITNQKRAEEALRESEGRLRRFYESGLIGVIYWNMEGRIIDANDKFLETVGYTREELAAGEIDWMNMTPVEYRHLDEHSVAELKATGANKISFEKEYIRKDGAKVPIIIAGAMLDEARFNGVAFVLDISDRKRAEEKILRQTNLMEGINRIFREAIVCESEEELGTVCLSVAEELTGSTIGFIGEIHADGQLYDITISNPEWDLCRMYDTTGHRRPPGAFKIHGLYGHVLEHGRSLLTNDPAAHPESIGLPEGHPPLTAFLGVPLVEKGKTIGLVGVGNREGGYSPEHQQILEDLAPAIVQALLRKRAEDEVRKSRDELERRVVERTEALRRQAGLLELAYNAVIVRDLNSKITFWNAGAEEIYGFTRSEALGQVTHTLLQTRFPVPFEEHMTALSTRGRWEGELTHTTKDGSQIVVLSRQALQRDEAGQPVAIMEINLEVTEQRRVEEHLRQAQKMEALGTLSGGIAHDFNNILAAIIGFTDLVTGHVDRESRDAHSLARVMEAAIRGRELVRQMLTFSRKSEHEKKPVSLSAIVRESVRLLRAAVPSSIDIKVDVPSESGFILADSVQVQQVLMNLCTNAAHAMSEKGGTLDIKVDDFSVDLSTGNDFGIASGLYMRLLVRDTGIGMPADVMNKIFDPFFTTKGLGEGTGLGLSVVHGIVKQHDGYIKVESEPGRGSAFTVYFPGIAEELEADAVSDDEMPTGSERVLFVDDEEALVEMGEDILAELGYEVTSRMNGREALALFRLDPSRFDLVITDQTMPEMTGIDLAKEILAIRADTPIIMCTGFSHLVDADKATAAGIKAFAMKPLTKREIARTIRKVLDE